MENDSSNLDPSQAPSLAQPLVFSNSKQNAISQPASGNTFSHHSMVSRKQFILTQTSLLTSVHIHSCSFCQRTGLHKFKVGELSPNCGLRAQNNDSVAGSSPCRICGAVWASLSPGCFQFPPNSLWPWWAVEGGLKP